MKVLITGSAGFLGSELVDYLKNHDYSIIGIDNNLYNRNKSIKECRDFRNFNFTESDKIDAVIHLAAISTNYDPPEKYYYDMAMLINYKETINFALKAKQAGIKKFIFASSASVYGHSKKSVDENSPLRPLTAYAKSKLRAEKELLSMKSDDFYPTILRMVTLFGLSKRMRFDLLVNNLILSIALHSTVILTSDGSTIRPQVHVKDVCKIYKKILESDPTNLSGEIINVGRSDYGLTVLEIAQIIAKYKNCKVVVGKRMPYDSRSYQVKFKKLENLFNDISFDHDIDYAINEIYQYLENKNKIKKCLTNPYLYNLKSIEYLIKNKIIDKDLKYLK